MKKIKYIIITILLIFIASMNVNAFSITSSSSVYIGSNVAVKVEASGLIGRFDITSSNENILAGSDSKWIEDSTITLYFTAKNTGTATITVNAVDVSDTNGNEVTGSRSITINVVEKKSTSSIDVNRVYSKNNYLKSLGIEGYDLTPEFDKETLEYSVILDPGTESINITATKEDGSARVKGSGEVEVTEGVNSIIITVTAENGNEREYIIKASVEEKNPIDVNIDNKSYRVVKKSDLLESKDGYINTTVKINDIEIPALYNEVTKITLIGLKDENGKIKLFSYDTSTGEYTEYKEIKFDLMNLHIIENYDSKYVKTTIKINDMEISAYKLDSVQDYYLLYATNLNTGNTGYYLYDAKENSVQRYNSDLLEKINNEKDKYFAIIIVLSCVCFLIMLFLLIQINRENKKDID